MTEEERQQYGDLYDRLVEITYQLGFGGKELLALVEALDGLQHPSTVSISIHLDGTIHIERVRRPSLSD